MTRLRRLPWGLVALVLGVGTFLYLLSLRVGAVAPDEEEMVETARLMGERFPGSVFTGSGVEALDDRGVQRLVPLVLAVPLDAIGEAAGFGLAHLLLCLLFASAAIPAYLLARGAGLTRSWALGAGALVVLVPWATTSTTFLTEGLAYPAALWVLYATWRACLVPGIRSDLLVCAAVLVAVLARTGLVALAAVAALVVALHTLGAVDARGRRARVAVAARTLGRDHPLLAVVLALCVLGVLLDLVADPFGGIVGSYRTSLGGLEWGPIPEKWAGQLAAVVTGVAAIPVLLGVPWALRHAVGPASPQTRALALCCLVPVPVVLLSTVYAGPEERFLMYLAPGMLVAATAALARREVSPLGVGVTGVVLAILLWRAPWALGDADPARLLTDPSQLFVARNVLPRLPGGATALALVVLVAAAALAGWSRLRLPRAALVGGLVLAAVGTVQFAQLGYALNKRAALAPVPGPLAQRTWVDSAAGGDSVAILADGVGDTAPYDTIWRELAFYNGQIDQVAATDGELTTLQGPGRPVTLAAATVAVDPRTGALTQDGAPAAPRLWLVPTIFERLGLVGRPVARSLSYPARLLRLTGAPRAAYAWSGVAEDGYVTSSARLRVFPRPDGCVRITLLGPGEYDGTHRFTLTGPGIDRSGTLRAQQRVQLDVPAADAPVDVQLRGQGRDEIAPERSVSLQIAATDATCPPVG